MFEKYDAYKDSGVEWLGTIPSNWDIFSLKRSIDGCFNGLWGSDPKENNDDIVVLRVADFNRNKLVIDNSKLTLRNIKKSEIGNRLLKKGDLLIEKSGGGDKTLVGCVVLFNENYKALTSNFVAKMTSKSNVNSYFLNYFFAALYANNINYQSIKQTTGIQNLDTNSYLNEKLALPSLHEQEAIVSFLNQKTSEIDQAIAIKEQQIALLNERKQIVIQKAVTQGLDPNVLMKDSGLNGVGNIPQDWEVIKFKYLAKVRYGLGQPPRQLDNGLKIIRATNVERGKIVEKGMLYIDPNDIPWDRNPTLNKDEIIVVRSGAYTGDSAIVTEEYAGSIAGYDMVATPFNCYPKFLSTVLLSHYVLYEQIYLLRMRSAQPHLNAEELNELQIVVPPMNQQQLIANYIEKVEVDIGEAISLIKQQLEKLKEYKTTLINDAVTGKIKVA